MTSHLLKHAIRRECVSRKYSRCHKLILSLTTGAPAGIRCRTITPISKSEQRIRVSDIQAYFILELEIPCKYILRECKTMDIHDNIYKKITPNSPLLYELWEPQGIAVVIGYSQQAAVEANLQACRADGVPIIRRRGGGGAVVLLPGVLCLTTAFLSHASDSPYYFFKKINQFLIEILQNRFGVQGLNYSGISDIAIGGQKVLGCSIFKSRNTYFYQGSLLVNADLQRISNYLHHPSKEPDYRNGRKHHEFLTTLEKSGYNFTVKEVKQVLAEEISKQLHEVVF